MLKIKQKNCRFRIDENKGMVVCWVEGVTIRDMVMDFMQEHNIDLVGMAPTLGVSHRVRSIAALPYKVVGIAVCEEGDIWNEELGKLIAFNKMKTKLMKLFFKHLQSCVDYISDTVEKMCQAADAAGEKFEKELRSRNIAIEEELKRNETVVAE